MTDRRKNIKADNEFVGKVLERTSGSPCKRACDQLPHLVDGDLGKIDRQLVQAHLEHCSGCRQVAVVMGWVGGQLPRMAEVDPGPSFLTGVLDRTSGRVERPEVVGERLVPGSSKLLDSLRRWWDRGLLRPNFAMEVAYVATVLIIMMATLPGSPLKGSGGKAINMLQAGSPPVVFVGTAFSQGSDWIKSKLTTNTGQLGVRVDESLEKIQFNLADRLERTAASRHAVIDGFAAVLPLIRAGDYGEAGSQGVQTLRAVGLTWQRWWKTEIEEG
jgi:hypothetical protein